MQSVNHDMDDLMRRAAADYPVKPHGEDWEKVAQQLSTPDTVTAENGHEYLKKLLLLLPLLFAAFVCDRFFVYEHGISKKATVARVAGNPDETNASEANTSFIKKEKRNDERVTQSKDVVAVNNPKEKAVALSLHKKPVKGTMAFENSIVTGNTVAPPSVDISNNPSFESTATHDGPFLNAVSHTKGVRVPVPLATVEPVQRLIITTPASTSKSLKAVWDGSLKKFYLSLLAGPDVSNVKGQKTEKTGYSIGLLAGYNINPKWAVEGGLLWDKKNYYSKGEYFKTDKIYLPPHAAITQVAGYCAMYEIPVNVRYNLFWNKKSSVFAIAGLSSYLMKKEDYDYVIRRYNQEYAGNKVYKNESKNWLAAGNVGVGYEHRLIEQISIRVEPYVRIPLKGVGIGSLPLRSMGIMVGITRPVY